MVIRGVPDLTAALANAVYEAADGDCEVGMCDRLLYVEAPIDAVHGWERIPELLAVVRTVRRMPSWYASKSPIW